MYDIENYFNAETIKEAVTLLKEHPDARVISGGSDLINLGGREVNARAYVSKFNFSGTDQEKKCGVLSGGERNRLHLALALKEDANVLLLDEPTSNLDSLNEGVILRSLQSERGGRTVVLVSHRASTMAVADEVYAAQEGRVS